MNVNEYTTRVICKHLTLTNSAVGTGGGGGGAGGGGHVLPFF